MRNFFKHFGDLNGRTDYFKNSRYRFVDGNYQYFIKSEAKRS